MKCVGMFDAKTHFSQLLAEVEQTRQSIVIERRGKKIATIAPYEDALSQDEKDRNDWIIATFRSVRAGQRPAKPGESIKGYITEGRRR